MGAHPLAPSAVHWNDEAVALDRWLTERPEALGSAVQRGFGRLPYLLKVLAAARPLSIQVHPTAARARAGYAADEAAGVPKDAPHRRYKDADHKPELLVALTPFDALCGFRSGPELVAALRAAPELGPVLSLRGTGPAQLRAMLESYFRLDDDVVHSALRRWLERLQTRHAQQPYAETADEAWVLRAHAAGGTAAPDRGLPFVLLLHRLQLHPGQAMFLPAGVPHAYLRGAGLELMANSDNVLRAGLTPKHVDAAELLEVVRFDSGPPPILEPVPHTDSGVATYPTPAAEFGLERITVPSGTRWQHRAIGPELVLALPADRDATLSVETDLVTASDAELRAGDCLFVPDGAPLGGTAGGEMTLYRAHVPSPRDPLQSFRGRTPDSLRFGTSGLRGRVEDITDLEAYVNTRGFLDLMLARGAAVPGTKVMLGGDRRPSTHGPRRSIMRAVAGAVLDVGMRVENCGRLPTPALALHGLTHGCPSVMVTGSHIPFDRNGIKFYTPTGEVLKSDEPEILAAVHQARRLEYGRVPGASSFDDGGWFRPGAARELAAERPEARRAYVQRYLQAFEPDALGGLRVVLYEHSAVGAEVLAEILRGLGAEVWPRGRASTFVPIDTEALGPQQLQTLQTLADEARAEHGRIDAVVSTDGDGDRPLVAAVDDDGRVHFIPGDVLGAIVAGTLRPDTVAVPVSATDLIETALPEATVLRTRIGSPWVIAALAEHPGSRAVGWEANGGFVHTSGLPTPVGTLAPLPTRDAALPIVAALRAARVPTDREPSGLLGLWSRLPARHGHSGLLDEVDPARAAALSRRYGLGFASLETVAFEPGVVRGRRSAGDFEPLEGEPLALALQLRARLATHFPPGRGYGAIRSIDGLDGIRVTFDNGDVTHVRPSGNAPQLRVYALADTAQRAQTIVRQELADDGALRQMLRAADADRLVSAVVHNIEHGDEVVRGGGAAAVQGVVCGSAMAREFWRRELEQARDSLGATRTLALHEDLPVNQALGLLLAWERLRPHWRAGHGALIAFVFGSGTRATPFTEAECGQKPALDAFVTAEHGGQRRRSSLVELALRTFAPVEAYLRRSGFEGLVVKWGDEVQIPTLDLAGTDARLRDADVVRFVSMRPITADDAANKDWVGVSAEGLVTAFIPRRPLARMEPLARRGLLQRRGDTLIGGINLGSIAISAALADILLEAFAADVHDPRARRSERPDLDPQFFTALTIAAIDDGGARTRAWAQARAESPAIETLAARMPQLLPRLRAALERFESRHGRKVRSVALDFGDQYWGDVGQHRRMRAFYGALRAPSPQGPITRALAGVPERVDDRGNRVVGDSFIGAGARVTNSVLIDARVLAGEVSSSVLIGTHCARLHATDAFDIGSTARDLTLESRAGTYKVVSASPLHVAAGQRATTVFVDDRTYLMRAHEDTDLRDKAHTYDVPILGNPISFAEAHAQATRADPVQTRAARDEARARVEASFDDP